MKKNYQLHTIALAFILSSICLFACNEKEHEPITPGTTWLHPAPNDEFYHYWKDSTFPCIRKLNGRTHIIHALKVKYCKCLFPLYYELEVTSSFMDSSKRKHSGDIMGATTMTTWPDWPKMTMESAPWNE